MQFCQAIDLILSLTSESGRTSLLRFAELLSPFNFDTDEALWLATYLQSGHWSARLSARSGRLGVGH